MSDIPEGYFVNGKELLDFRRQPDISFVVKPKSKKKRSPSKSRQTLIARDGINCHYCMVPTKKYPGPKHQPDEQTIEHVYPRSIGGSNALKNLVIACYKCNHEFGDRLSKCSCGFCMQALRDRGR